MSNSFDYNLKEKNDNIRNVIAISLNSMRSINASALTMAGRTVIRITSPFPILDDEKEALTDAIDTTIKLMEVMEITDDEPDKLKGVLEDIKKRKTHAI